MRNILAILIISLGLYSCGGTSTNTDVLGESSDAIIAFDEDNFDFGTITEGDLVSHTFAFTNEGSDPLEILSVNVSCGCTVASKPTQPIDVGEKGEITINFNSTGKVGPNRKSVGVFSNAQNSQEVLIFTANVVANNN